MKKNKFYSLLLALAFAVSAVLASALVACKPEENVDPPEAKVIGITLDTSEVKTTFAFGETFTYEGLKVIAQMSDETTKAVDLNDCKINVPNMENAGKRNVAVAYEGQTARYQITIEKKKIPEISATSLLNIEGENDSVAYRVEAENIDMAKSGTQLAEGAKSFVAEAPADAEITGGGKYLTGYGVKWNYFGFTFTSDKEYTGVTLVFRVAYSGSKATLNIAENLNVYLNYNDEGEAVTGQLSAIGTVESGVCKWKDVVVRNVTIPAGTNKLTFEALSGEVPDIDYVDFYVGMRYIGSVAELPAEGKFMKDLETFDTEFASTRKDWADANPDKIVNGLGLETVTKESEGKTTSGGKSVAALNAGSQLSTTLRLAQDSTVKLNFIAANSASYIVKNMWEFYIDGVKLEMVEEVDIVGGNPATGEYWDWIPTCLGTYNLSEGDHLFLVKNVGGACNIDGVEFEVISSGSFDPSGCDLDKQTPVEPPKPDTVDLTIAGGGTYKIEVEKLDTTNWVLREDLAAAGMGFTENWSNDFGSGACAKGFTDGTVITATVKVEQDCTLTLSMRMSFYNDAVYDFSHTKITFAGQTLTPVPAGEFGHREASDYWKWVDVALGTVEVKAGEYEFKMETNGGMNLDYFMFTNDSEPAPETVDLTIAGSGSYKIEAENLDTTNWVLRPDLAAAGQGFTENWSNDFGSGVCAKGFTDGTVITATVKVEQDCMLTLSMRMSFYNDAKYDFSHTKITFAGQTLTPVPAGDFGHRDAGDYWKWVDVALGTVEVKAGVYELKMETNGGMNLDYFMFENGSAPAPETVDLTIAGTGSYKIEAENLDTTNWVLRPDLAAAGQGFTENWSNDFGSGVCAKGFTDGTVITATVKVEQDCTLTLSMRMSFYNDAAYDFSYTKITFAGQTLTPVPAGDFGHRDAGDWWKWVEVALGTVNVKAGTYEFKMETNGGMNIDYFQFVNADAVVSQTTTIQAENLNTDGIVLQAGHTSCIENDTKNPSNQCLKGVSEGSVISFTFVLTEDAEVSISANMSKYESDYNTSGKFTVTLNGVELTVESVMLGRAEDGSNDWHNWKTVGLGGAQVLKAGTYTVTLTATAPMPNIDSFTINVTPQA